MVQRRAIVFMAGILALAVVLIVVGQNQLAAQFSPMPTPSNAPGFWAPSTEPTPDPAQILVTLTAEAQALQMGLSFDAPTATPWPGGTPTPMVEDRVPPGLERGKVTEVWVLQADMTWKVIRVPSIDLPALESFRGQKFWQDGWRTPHTVAVHEALELPDDIQSMQVFPLSSREKTRFGGPHREPDPAKNPYIDLLKTPRVVEPAERYTREGKQ